jgi:hypothetical protein
MTQDIEPVKSTWLTSIQEVIKGLKNHPVLLFVIGLGLILLSAGSLAFESLRWIVIAMLILGLTAMIVWISGEAIKGRANHIKVQGGDALVGKGVDAENIVLTGGNAKISGEGQVEGFLKGGNAGIGQNAKVKKVRLKGGDAEKT